MKNELKGFEKIFAFTFRNHTGKKSFRTVTASVAILCILIPALVMTGLEYFSGDNVENGVENVQQEQVETVDISALKRIFVADITRGESGLGEGRFTASDFNAVDYRAFAGYTGVDLSDVEFIDCGKDLNRALAETEGTADALILAVDMQGTEYVLNLLIPQNSGLNEDVAYAIDPVFDTYAAAQAAKLSGPAEPSDSKEQLSEKETMKKTLGQLIPYVNIMLIYFFVLLYGQGVSQSVVLEKSSKLMDIFLISVKPSAMVLGKMTAICLSGVLQMFLWIAALICGFVLGNFGVKMLNPDSEMLMVQLMDDFGKMTNGMFSAVGVIVALAIILAGMLMYCALAGIGGALAGKQDDLSSTNILFTLLLVASFFACLYGGGITGGEPKQWLYFLPFTSIMVTPSAAMLGTISLAKSFGALMIILITALAFTVLAGRIYKNMALYKGDIPGIKQILKMIK